MNKKLSLLLCILTSFLLIPQTVFAETEQILITISEHMDQVIFDGKWSFSNTETAEWKFSSYNVFKYEDGNKIVLRSAHQGEFIYFLIDFVTDQNIDSGLDKAVICFDTENNKSQRADENDYCFLAILDGKTFFSYQGGSFLVTQSNFKKIPNHSDAIVIGTSSDNNDRYSKIPHSSYEFKIPTDLIGRENVYGFYLGVYDHNTNKLYTWPPNIYTETKFRIDDPVAWGELVSPDKSLPEFEFPFLALFSSLILILIMTRIKNRVYTQKA